MNNEHKHEHKSEQTIEFNYILSHENDFLSESLKNILVSALLVVVDKSLPSLPSEMIYPDKQQALWISHREPLLHISQLYLASLAVEFYLQTQT